MELQYLKYTGKNRNAKKWKNTQQAHALHYVQKKVWPDKNNQKVFTGVVKSPSQCVMLALMTGVKRIKNLGQS